MRAVLNSYGSIATGLGSEARWMWNQLPFDVWVQGAHARLGWGSIEEDTRGRPILRDPAGSSWRREIMKADVVVSVERCVPEAVARFAAQCKKRLVVLANPEWTAPGMGWLSCATHVFARTALCERHLQALQLPNVKRVEVPLDLSEFPFRQRNAAHRVVFTNGWGGVCSRKGWPAVERMLELAPASIEVFSQAPIDRIAGWRGQVDTPAALYETADVVLVPSRFEGVGLSVLEAMASGCLVVATNAEPMKEFVTAAYGQLAPLFLLPVGSTERVRVAGQEWTARDIDPVMAVEQLAAIRSLDPNIVRALSMRGRRYIEDHHGAAAREQLWREITDGL